MLCFRSCCLGTVCEVMAPHYCTGGLGFPTVLTENPVVSTPGSGPSSVGPSGLLLSLPPVESRSRVSRLRWYCRLWENPWLTQWKEHPDETKHGETGVFRSETSGAACKRPVGFRSLYKMILCTRFFLLPSSRPTRTLPGPLFLLGRQPAGSSGEETGGVGCSGPLGDGAGGEGWGQDTGQVWGCVCERERERERETERVRERERARCCSLSPWLPHGSGPRVAGVCVST